MPPVSVATRAPARPHTEARPDPDAGPGLRPGAGQDPVTAAARRRAVRGGDRQTDTAHLLHSLLDLDPDVRSVLEEGAWRVDRLLGYLVQRTIGYGLRWRRTAEGSAVAPRGRPGGEPLLSPVAAAAVESAAARARARGADRADGRDLLAALAADRECRAAEVLRRSGVDTELLVRRLGGR